MRFDFTVSVEVERTSTSGPFASRADLEAELIEAIEGADPSSLSPGENEYEVTDWRVEANDITPKKRAVTA